MMDPRDRATGETYGLEEEMAVAPPLPGGVVATRTVDELIDRLAADLVVHAENCVREFGDFQLALSGGDPLELLYARLMYDPNYRSLPWRRTHLWLAEETRVPLGDERSTFRQIHETIVDHADIPQDQVHPILSESASADVDYEAQLREALAWREKGHDRLDFVLLLMGEDGRVAGLCPGSDPLREASRLVMFSPANGRGGADRITMTLTLINAARFVAVLATGKPRAAAIQRVSAGTAPLEELPVMGLSPLNGELKWYLDAGACGG